MQAAGGAWRAVAVLSLLLSPVGGAVDAEAQEEVVYVDGRAAHPSRLLMRSRGGLSSGEIVSLAELAGAGVESELAQSGVSILTVATPGADSLSAAIADLEATGMVEYVEPDYLVTIDATPNDPSFGSLWGLHNTGQTGGTPDADVDAPETWDTVTSSPGVVVVIDTGIDYDHADLAANVWVNPGEIADNGIDDDGNGYVDDVHGINTIRNDGDPRDDHYHGTHVAGTIGAVGNNGLGVVGVSWSGSLMACKFLNSSGNGFTSDAVECLEYVSMMKQSYGVDIRVTNNSWGGGSFSQALRDAIQANDDLGILFVAAAGNSGLDNDAFPHYPSSYDNPNIVSVAATDDDDQLAGFSNYGALSVDLGAPGVGVLSTSPGNGYTTLSGTSMASPHVAGAAMLTWAQHPAYSHLEVRQNLLSTVDPVASLAGRVGSQGRLNLFRSAACVPGDWQLSLSLPQDFSVLEGRATVVTAQLASCALARGAVVTVSFDNGDATVPLRDDGNVPDVTADDGVYSGSWTPGALGAVTATAEALFESDLYSLSVDGEVIETGGLVGYYDMGGAGSPFQEAPILAAGGQAELLQDLTPADLAGIDVLFVQNASNFGYGTEYLARLGSVAAAVESGLVLILHDRAVDDAESILPGGADFDIVRDLVDDANIDILDDTTLVTHGPGGSLDDQSLDNGTSSSHGFAVAGSLPGDARLILSRTDPDDIVTMCYGYGSGAVVYSTIPLDFYLAGSGPDPVRTNMAEVYAPNTVAYGLAGACSGPCIPGDYELSTSLEAGFAAYQGRQLAVTARLAGCELALGASVEASFSNGDPDLPLRDDGIAPDATADDGIYTGAWVPEGIGPVSVQIEAVHELQSYTLSIDGTVSVLPEMVVGLVADNSTHAVVVVDAIDDVALGSVSIPTTGTAVGDCAITSDQALGFVTDFQRRVWVVDVPNLALAPGNNPIAISNSGEDVALSADERYLLVCDGSLNDPVSVIDVDARVEASSFPMSRGCNSVDVCSDGSVLVTSANETRIRRLHLEADGTLTDTGESVSFSGTPNNVYCGPDGSSGVVILRNGTAHSFTIPGMVAADQQNLTGTFGISGMLSRVGDRLFARSNPGSLDVYEYTPGTGQIGASQLSLGIAATETFFGMDQMALHPSLPKVYVSEPSRLRVVDSVTGAGVASITHPSLVRPSGVCFGSGAGAGPPPDEVCGSIEDEDFGAYDTYACAPLDAAGTVEVQTQAELDAYQTDFGYDGSTVKNLLVSFDPTGDVDIRSPCHVTLAGGASGLYVMAEKLRVFGRTGVVVGDELENQDGAIDSGGAVTLVSSTGGVHLARRTEVSAGQVCLQAEGTAWIDRRCTVQADAVEVVSTGDRLDSHAVVDNKSFVTADLLRIEASRDAVLGRDVIVNVGDLLIRSTGSYATSAAVIKPFAHVTTGSLSITSANEAKVRSYATLHVEGEFEMEALTESRCKVAEDAVITFGSKVGNCAPFLVESEIPDAVPGLSAPLRVVAAVWIALAAVAAIGRRRRVVGAG